MPDKSAFTPQNISVSVLGGVTAAVIGAVVLRGGLGGILFAHLAPLPLIIVSLVVSGLHVHGPSTYLFATLIIWLTTAVAEVAHHLRREAVARGVADARRTYRQYTSVLAGGYLDIRGQQATRADVYDPADYTAGQRFGEAVRATGLRP